MYNISKASFKEKNYIKILAVLIEACTRLSSSLRLPDVLAQVSQAAFKITDMSRAVIGLHDKHKGVIETVAGFGHARPLSTYQISDLGDEFAALTRGRAVVIEDALNADLSSKARELQRSLDMKSALAVPIMQENSLIGVIFTYAIDRSRPIPDEIVRSMLALADQAAVAIKNAMVNEELQDSKRLSEALNQINESLLSTSSIGEVLDLVVAEISRAAGADKAMVVELEGDTIIGRYARGFASNIRDMRLRLDDFPSVKTALQENHPVLIENAHTDTRVNKRLADEHGYSASITIPLSIQGQVIGGLSLLYNQAQRFDAKYVEFARRLSNALTLAFENARLFEAEEEERKRAKSELEISKLLLRAADTLAESIDLQQIGERLADVIVGVTGRSRIFIGEVDLKTNEIILLATRNGETLQAGGTIPINELLPELQRAIKERKTIIVDYASPSPPEAAGKRNEAFGARRVLYVPIKIGLKLVGYIAVDEPGDDREFTGRDVELVEGIAAQAAVTIENARLHEKSVARARTLEAVVQMGSMITSTLNMRDTLIQIADYATILVDVPAAIVLIPNTQPGILRVAASTGFSRDLTGEELSLADIITIGFDKPKPSFIDDLDLLSTIPLFAEIVEQGFVSAAVSPLYFEGALRGLIIIADSAPLSLTDEDTAAFRLFVVQAATAMRNAERYEAERHIADTLQEALLTVPEKIPGVTYGTLYSSATEAAKVGGDFYDIFEIEHGKVGIIIGDVAGKGIEATALTTVVKTTIKAHAYEDGTPARVMTKTNEFITRINPPGSFVTVFFGVVDLQTGVLVYCSAGHPPAIIKRTSGEVELLERHSPIIGAFPGMHYQSFAETLREGDILVIYTDGIIEARCHDDEFFQEERLVELIRDVSVSAKEMPQIIYDTVMSCTDGILSDDTALLSLSLL